MLLQWKSSSNPALSVSQATPLDGMWKLRHSRGNPIIINCQRSPTGTSACCCGCVGFVSVGCWWNNEISRVVREWEFTSSCAGMQWMRTRRQRFNKLCFQNFIHTVACLRGSSSGGLFLILTTQGWFWEKGRCSNFLVCYPNTNKTLSTPLETNVA